MLKLGQGRRHNIQAKKTTIIFNFHRLDTCISKKNYEYKLRIKTTQKAPKAWQISRRQKCWLAVTFFQRVPNLNPFCKIYFQEQGDSAFGDTCLTTLKGKISVLVPSAHHLLVADSENCRRSGDENGKTPLDKYKYTHLEGVSYFTSPPPPPPLPVITSVTFELMWLVLTFLDSTSTSNLTCKKT